MTFSGVSGLQPAYVSNQVQRAAAPTKPEPANGASFTERIGDAVKDLAATQSKAETSAKAFEMGAETDLASVMVDQQVASLGFQMALNVRNKALGAYRDIMNMPV